jgi:hypothetical protein
MYWSRTGNPFDIGIFILLCLAWSTGGWLIVTHAFRLRPVERLLSGITAGFLLFITLSNLLANLVQIPQAFWAGSMLVLAGGLLAAWRSKKEGPWLSLQDWRAWPQLAVLLILSLIFTLIGRGLAIFDDYLHIPLVSVMAAGDIPPHFYLNPAAHFAYHYGLHVFAASLVRIGGFYPWSAWDFSKALVIALTIVLSWLWLRRVTRSSRAAALGSFFVSFAGGARWLLLLTPFSILLRISPAIHLTNTGADTGANLLEVLSRPWAAEGTGPFPFPFAFHNGLFVPAIFTLGSSGALPFATLLLLLLLVKERHFWGKWSSSERSWPIAAVLTLSLIFASLALTAEHIFVFLWAGIALSGVIYLAVKRIRRQCVSKEIIVQWGLVLLLSGLLSVVQGAFITEAVRNFLLRLQGMQSGTGGSYNYFSFTPRWPPALDTAHFGELSLLDPRQLFVLLAEIGPVILLAPAASLYAWRRIWRRDGLQAGLGIAALLSLLLVLFFQYGVERSGTRLPAASLWIWALLGFPIAWMVFMKSRPVTRLLIRAAYFVAIFGGLVIFAVQLTAIPAPQLTYFINSNDARIGQQIWNNLPEGTQIFDRIPYRAVALTGRPSRSSLDYYHSFPDWEALAKTPDPVAIAQAGYDYIYMDDEWWWSLGAEQWGAFKNPCVHKLIEQNPADGDFRWLLDVHSCR